MASRKRSAANQHHNNTVPDHNEEWSSGNEGSGSNEYYSRSNQDNNNITTSKKTGDSTITNNLSTKGVAPINDAEGMKNIKRNDDCGGNSSTTDSIKLDESLKLSEPFEEDEADMNNANTSTEVFTNNEKSSNKANKSMKSNEIKPSTCLVLQRLTNRQESQQKVSTTKKIAEHLQYLDDDESERWSSTNSVNLSFQRSKNCPAPANDVEYHSDSIDSVLKHRRVPFQESREKNRDKTPLLTISLPDTSSGSDIDQDSSYSTQ